MNVHLVILITWLALGVICVLFLLWFLKTHEEQMADEIPEIQIFGCIPPPVKWLLIILFLFFGPFLLLWGLYEAIQDSRKAKDNNISGGSSSAAAVPDVSPQTVWMVLFGLFGAGLTAYQWAVACPAKTLDTFLVGEARTLGMILIIFGLPGILARRNPFPDLRNFVLPYAPLYLVGLVPRIASMTAEWEGGFCLGVVGAAVGTAAGAGAGWLFKRWIMPEYEKRRARESEPGSNSPA